MSYVTSLTQQKVQITGDVVPLVGSVITGVVSELALALVLAELVDGLEDESYHPLLLEEVLAIAQCSQLVLLLLML